MRGLLDWVSTCVPLSCAATLPLVRTFEVGDFLRGSTWPCATRHLSAVGMLSPSSPPIPDSIGFRRDCSHAVLLPSNPRPLPGDSGVTSTAAPLPRQVLHWLPFPLLRSGQRYATPRRDFRQRRGSGAEPDKAILAPTPNKRSFWVKPVLSLALFLHAALWVQPASRTGSPLSMKMVILRVCRQLSRVAAAS
jgi:hypothetical protein